jgi:hypothetical protein
LQEREREREGERERERERVPTPPTNCMIAIQEQRHSGRDEMNSIILFKL